MSGEICDDCGKPITSSQPSYYQRNPVEEIGRVFHSRCGPAKLSDTPTQIDDAMVERALIAWDEAEIGQGPMHPRKSVRECLRAALEAALFQNVITNQPQK